MEPYIVRVKSIVLVTHDVLKIVTEKPKHFNFICGQAAEIAINKEDWKNEKRPFTFTSLPSDSHLEFTIKVYQEHKGATNQLLSLHQGDELILHDVFGAIQYQGEGLFIAGGAGVTPFISILRHLQAKNEVGSNKLIFANKKKVDIILEEEFTEMLGINFINVLSDEKLDGYVNGLVTQYLIKSNTLGVNPFYYICGPPPMMESIKTYLIDLKTDVKQIIEEKF